MREEAEGSGWFGLLGRNFFLFILRIIIQHPNQLIIIVVRVLCVEHLGREFCPIFHFLIGKVQHLIFIIVIIIEKGWIENAVRFLFVVVVIKIHIFFIS
ncbi:hypothetical protein SDC9_174790 [bioreactor metagenome]|uniref:Uncharacterized protein n=1 Tax=bioreactor metagenome TaxID=1076179 RepID=A0A645GN75_9ZZZZ